MSTLGHRDFRKYRFWCRILCDEYSWSQGVYRYCSRMLGDEYSITETFGGIDSEAGLPVTSTLNYRENIDTIAGCSVTSTLGHRDFQSRCGVFLMASTLDHREMFGTGFFEANTLGLERVSGPQGIFQISREELSFSFSLEPQEVTTPVHATVVHFYTDFVAPPSDHFRLWRDLIINSYRDTICGNARRCIWAIARASGNR